MVFIRLCGLSIPQSPRLKPDQLASEKRIEIFPSPIGGVIAEPNPFLSSARLPRLPIRRHRFFTECSDHARVKVAAAVLPELLAALSSKVPLWIFSPRTMPSRS